MVEIKNRWTGVILKTVDAANLREADLCEADLRGADLCEADLRGANLREANLRGANLREANLREADLCGANLREADLCEADLRGAKNIPPIEVVPEFKEKILAQVNNGTCSLDMTTWHACETAHCLAGWATTLHPQGKLLESILGVKTAGALIFNACCGEVPSFYGTDEQAMEWLQKKEATAS